MIVRFLVPFVVLTIYGINWLLQSQQLDREYDDHDLFEKLLFIAESEKYSKSGKKTNTAPPQVQRLVHEVTPTEHSEPPKNDKDTKMTTVDYHWFKMKSGTSERTTVRTVTANGDARNPQHIRVEIVDTESKDGEKPKDAPFKIGDRATFTFINEGKITAENPRLQGIAGEMHLRVFMVTKVQGDVGASTTNETVAKVAKWKVDVEPEDFIINSKTTPQGQTYQNLCMVPMKWGLEKREGADQRSMNNLLTDCKWPS